jgi:hypothetical protein
MGMLSSVFPSPPCGDQRWKRCHRCGPPVVGRREPDSVFHIRVLCPKAATSQTEFVRAVVLHLPTQALCFSRPSPGSSLFDGSVRSPHGQSGRRHYQGVVRPLAWRGRCTAGAVTGRPGSSIHWHVALALSHLRDSLHSPDRGAARARGRQAGDGADLALAPVSSALRLPDRR